MRLNYQERNLLNSVNILFIEFNVSVVAKLVLSPINLFTKSKPVKFFKTGKVSKRVTKFCLKPCAVPEIEASINGRALSIFERLLKPEV